MSETPNTDPLARVREIALLLPGAHEQATDGGITFMVHQQPFAKLNDDGSCLMVRAGTGGWSDLALNDPADWTLVEDLIARSWELSAPAGLLEAGGR